MYLFGDNSKYTGIITVPNSVEKVYFEQNSQVNIAKENGSKPEIADIPEDYKPEDNIPQTDEQNNGQTDPVVPESQDEGNKETVNPGIDNPEDNNPEPIPNNEDNINPGTGDQGNSDTNIKQNINVFDIANNNILE